MAAGGALPFPWWHGERFVGLERFWPLAIPPIAAACFGLHYYRRHQRLHLVVGLSILAVVFNAGLFGMGTTAFDAFKAPRPLAGCIPGLADREIRVASYQYFEPSLVFYCGREVTPLTSEAQVLELLRYPIPVYLFMPASTWSEIAGRVDARASVLGSHRDFYKRCDVVVVTNDQSAATLARSE